MLIDDDVAMHDLVKRTIKKAGLTLLGATNGRTRIKYDKRS